MTQQSQGKTYLFLGAIILVAVILRLIGIGSEALWGDEALTIVLSEWSLRDMLLMPTDPSPVLYYALHKLFFAPDASAALVRTISLAAGIGSVALIYTLGRLCFGVREGLICALLLAVSTIHIDYSIEARAYSLTFFFTLAMSVCLMAYLRDIKGSSDKPENAICRYAMLAGFGLSCVLAFYTHITAVFWIAFLNLILIGFVFKARKIHWAEVAVLFVFMAALSLPGLYRMMLQMQVGDSFSWLQQANVMRFVSNQAELYLPLGFWDNDFVRGRNLTIIVKNAVVLMFGVSVAGMAYFGGRTVFARLKTENHAALWLILAYLAAPFALWLFGYIARPIYMTRAVLFALPGFLLLISLMVVSLPRNWPALVTGGLTLIFLASIALQGFAMPKSDWRDANAYLAENVRAGDLIVVCPDYAYPALRHAVTTPIEASVLAYTATGDLQMMEDRFGANPDWSRTYYTDVVVPVYNTKYGKAAVQPSYLPRTTALNAGQSVWAVNDCKKEKSKTFGQSLSGIDAASTKVWEDKSMLEGPSIIRYNVSKNAPLQTVEFERAAQ